MSRHEEDRFVIENRVDVNDEGDFVEEFRVVDTNGGQERDVAYCPHVSDVEVVCLALNAWHATVPYFRKAYGL